MAPNDDLVADASPAPFESAAEDSPSIDAHIGGFWQDTGLGWDHEVGRASAQRQDGRVGSCERGPVVVVDGGDAAVEARRGELVGS
jgi:hypothetical protein